MQMNSFILNDVLQHKPPLQASFSPIPEHKYGLLSVLFELLKFLGTLQNM